MKGRGINKIINEYFYKLICIFLLFKLVGSQFNLYLNEAEAQQITGIPGELYYIRNNSIQENSLALKLIVPTHVNNVSFIWYNKILPNQLMMFYRVTITTSIKNVIEDPEINIQDFGKVPIEPTAIQIDVKCLHNGIVDVNIEFIVNIFSSANITHLVIKLQKICHNLDDSYVLDTMNGPQFNNSFLYESWQSIEHSRRMFYIGVGFSALVFFLFFLVLLVCYLYTRRSANLKRNGDTNLYDSSIISHLNESHETNKISLLHDEKHNFELLLNNVKIETENITLTNKLEEGIHGMLFNGLFTNKNHEKISVNIKILKDPMHLLNHDKRFEVSLLYFDIEFNYILPLLGYLTNQNNLPMFVYPKFNGVCLKKFLQIRNPDRFSVNSSKLLGSPQMVSICSQICLALIHLHGYNIIHKDVATRNCIISEDMLIKLTDGLLSEDLYPMDYEGSNFQPIRWLAPEIIQNNEYSVAGDVWSFGVTMWEIASFGNQPYLDVSVQHLLDFLLAGYRLSQPIRCSNEMFSIMACCWSLQAEQRTNLSELCLFLQQFYVNLKQYV